MQSAGFDRRGALLVLGSATAWSFGGTIARYLSVTESWTIVFWRAFFASVFLLWFMLHRQGLRGKGLIQLENVDIGAGYFAVDQQGHADALEGVEHGRDRLD